MASFSSSSLLVSVQFSVSSSWRLAHRAKTATKASTDAMPIRTKHSVRRLAFGATSGDSASVGSELMERAKSWRPLLTRTRTGVREEAHHPPRVGCTPHSQTPARVLAPGAGSPGASDAVSVTPGQDRGSDAPEWRAQPPPDAWDRMTADQSRRRQPLLAVTGALAVGLGVVALLVPAVASVGMSVFVGI